jgi:hypothetical protein
MASANNQIGRRTEPTSELPAVWPLDLRAHEERNDSHHAAKASC